jgi:hypothetical protein
MNGGRDEQGIGLEVFQPNAAVVPEYPRTRKNEQSLGTFEPPYRRGDGGLQAQRPH